MSWFMKILGSSSNNGAEVDTDHNIKAALTSTPGFIGPAIAVTELDDGSASGTQETRSIDIDNDYKLRVGPENLMDVEVFDYTAQNSGKHTYTTTTLTFTWSAAGLVSNGSGITTTTTGATFGSYAFFPLFGTASTYAEIQASFSALPTTNTIVDFGLFLRGATTAFAPLDGVYFRLNSAGISGVCNSNGTETISGPFAFTYTPNQKYQFIIQVTEREVRFFIDNTLYGKITTPSGQGRPCMAASLPFSVRHAIVGGAAGAVLQATFNSYTVSLGGPAPGDELAVIGNRVLGSYQGLSGGTMGSLANYANSANPTAAVPTNTTAALGTGLGGQFWETATLALNTDGIICSYLVPAGTVNVQGRRLIIRGISLWSYIQTVIAGGPLIAQWSLAFGHTALSLATTEAVAAKAPRRIALPFDQAITAAQAVSTKVAQACLSMQFLSPVIVNPGEYVALVKKHIGTVATAGVIGHVVTFDYGWE